MRRLVVLMVLLDRLVALCAVLVVLVLLCLLLLALHLHMLMVLLELLSLKSLLLELLQLLELPLFVHLAQAQLLPPLDELLSDLLLLLRAQLHVPFAPLSKLLLLSYKAWIEPAFLVLFLPPGRRHGRDGSDGTRRSGGGKACRALLKRLLKMLRLMLWNEGLLWLLGLGVLLLLHLQERLVMEWWLGLRSVLWQKRVWMRLGCRRRQ